MAAAATATKVADKVASATKVADKVADKAVAATKVVSSCFGWVPKKYRKYVKALLVFIVLFGIAIFLTWLILRPTKPQFFLNDMNLIMFNASATVPTLSSNIQTTISSRNPNKRIGIYYDQINVHIAYRTQPITAYTSVQPSFQGHKDVTTWSPFLYGIDVPLEPVLATVMAADIEAGLVPVNVRATGKVRWKVGTWVSGRYHINVNCPTQIYFGKKDGVYMANPAIRSPNVIACQVEV